MADNNIHSIGDDLQELFGALTEVRFEEDNNVYPQENADVDANKELIDLWNGLKDKDGLLNLLNATAKVCFGNDARPYTARQLNYNAYSSNNPKRYVSFQIPKKKPGEFRTIDAPNPTLKTIQQCLNHVFQLLYTPNNAAVGFAKGRSVVSGASKHLNQRYVYNIDLKDFFPSITSGRLFKRLQSKPFGLNAETASLVTDLCCDKQVLPQGAPTSPTITNFICERLDRKLQNLAKAYNLRYTRYADDITFSGMQNVFADNGRFCQSLRHIIEDEEHFKINEDKTRLSHRGERQEVTGLIVNDKPNVSRKYVRQLRTMLHNWEQMGYETAQSEFIKNYHPTKNVNGQHHIENIISGKLDYMKMVKGANDSTYRKLNDRFEKLIDTKKSLTNNAGNVYVQPSTSAEKNILLELEELLNLIETDNQS